ncbi:MAG: MDR/SDR family oxidoreductase [Vicinamibacterales bacterium]
MEIAVEATGLNFKDVLNVLGMYPGDPGPLGGECAGRVVATGSGVDRVHVGDRVLAIAGGSFASHVVARAEFVVRMPDAMPAVEGAALPIAFVTAAYCLRHLAAVRPGQRVLIHAAAGGVGLAAVPMAQQAGAEVLATAGSDRKRSFLRDCGVTHVFDSRSAAFADGVMAAAGGEGVDVVLNALSGAAIEASFAVLRRGGTFLEIGKRDIKDPDWVRGLGRDIAYHIVDWGETAAREPAVIARLLSEVVADVERGALRSLPRHEFPMDAVERAFRLMAEARHTGKVVVRHAGDGSPVIRADGTYLVTGGLAGLGLAVGHWLARQGAGRIVLVSRRGVTPSSAAGLPAGAMAEALDITDGDAVRTCLDRLRVAGPPLRGVFHCAGVLDAAALLQQDADRFDRVLAPKVQGTIHLDRFTRQDALDVFVDFSSIASVLGAPGQANHAAACAYIDTAAAGRSADGHPTISINWGPWSEVGAAVDRQVSSERLAAEGFGSMTVEQGLAALDRVLRSNRAEVMVVSAAWAQVASRRRPNGHPDALLADLLDTRQPVEDHAAPAHARASSSGDDLRARSRACRSPGSGRPSRRSCASVRFARSEWTRPVRSTRGPRLPSSAWIPCWPWSSATSSARPSARRCRRPRSSTTRPSTRSPSMCSVH